LFGAGLGQQCDWYRNILACSEVVVQVGHRTFKARAEPIDDPEEHRKLLDALVPAWDRYGPPQVVRRLMRRFMRFDYDAELAAAQRHGDELPIVVLVPNDVGLATTGSPEAG
jgi:hypothetical protein